MKLKWSALLVPALLLASTAASADDGEKTLKEMTGGNTDNQLTVSPLDIGHSVSDAEHAFIDMMKFYVPSQDASGLVVPIDYNNVDVTFVEQLPAAKPLISVFIYGPTIPVEDTAFAHSFMDVYGAVSLNDGVNWKTTNLSQSADMSSFTLGVDGQGSGGDDDGHDVPADHTKVEKDDGLIAFHAPGMDYPYANQCTECHGATLEGGHHNEPSCYSCHGPEWKENAPDGVMVVYIEEAYAKLESEVKIKLEVEGEVEGVDGKTTATLLNGFTDAPLATEEVEDDGEFEFELVEYDGMPPCTVAVIVDGVESATVPVIDKNTKEPVEECDGEPYDLTEYPGGAYNVFHATVGNKVLAAWPSRYCRQGQPAYSFAYDADPEEDPADPNVLKRNALEEFLGIDVEYDLYLTDLFEVGGSQRSIDFAEEGYPQAAEVPFGCVWTARGVLLPGDDPRTGEIESSHMVWTKPERLTSGRRDPNRIEVKGVKGAGFVITWQEDPDGLRPGQGLGPGEGWSGAVAHDKTDVWYSFIPWEYFDIVEVADTSGDGIEDPINIADHDLLDSGRPQVYVPMAMPMRLTNNAKCNPARLDDPDDQYFSYCNVEYAADYGLQDFCANRVEIPQGQDGTLGEICVNAEGLPNIANTASTRPRTSLQGYASVPGGPIDSAWVIVAAEESKGLGRYAFLPDGTPCEDVRADDPAYNPDCGADIGKNQWYFSFDMGDPWTSSTNLAEHGLVQNLVSQGNLLNQPEVDWRTGDFYPMINTSEMWDFGAFNYDLYDTEIARRSSLLVQSIGKALSSQSGILATPSWKQGAMRQGGPADTMLRRIVLPDGYVEGIANNPYAFTNMECLNPDGTSGWVYDDTNPYYPDGVCMAPATNLSGVVPDICKNDTTGAVGEDLCPTVDFSTGTPFGVGDTNPILQGYIQGEGNTTRVLTWHQCPGAGGADGDALDTSELDTVVDCESDDRTDLFVNLKDQSWYNPLDVSKGHRGFIDGDFVMFLYAWSPNWRLNAKGNDRYDLYVRRSFDGGQTWRTTPGSFTASDGLSYSGDGTVTCETYRSAETGTPGALEPHVCFEYDPGDHEQARNITQHSRMRVTTLDPRYAPTAATIADGCLDAVAPSPLLPPVAFDTSLWTCDDLSAEHDSDLRNPSRYFMVFETGDNSTVQVGEAEPMDLFYGRAEGFGDDYTVWTETDTGFDDPESVCYPTMPHDDAKVMGTVVEGSGFCNEFERMNAGGDTHSSEANLEANPDGSKLYGVWAQWVIDEATEETVDSEAMIRRMWWIDDWRSADEANTWNLPGTNQSATP